ncbi:hypothetical protein [Desulfobacter sp.]|uniref:hypothetical protein n=1 Tax=Desulfobacter sp. TaxID=2294 RepID=UPI00257C20C4|nr:hypothetical protein [Desulfobacter sp.]
MGKSEISTEVPEESIGNYLCPICKQETEHRVLTIVHKYDSEDFNGVEVEFWNEYVTTQCNGCKTISFCHKNRCSEELDFDSNGIPLFNYHTKTYPKLENNLENASFIEESRILEIQAITSVQFNTKKLCQMLLELNQGYKDKSLFSCIFLIRSILDHVPPIFGKSNFNEVANNYIASGRSFKDAMLHLQNSSRKIADKHLHSPIKNNEVLPTVAQIEFRADFDLLLAEIIQLLNS